MAPIPSNEPLNNTSTGHSNGSSNDQSSDTSSQTSLPSATNTPIDLSTRLAINRSPKAFSSFAVSRIPLPAGSLFSSIAGTSSATKAYSSVQTGRSTHIELNSDLVYCNHSCAPTVEFDMAAMEVRVARDRDLSAGDMLTFWYPSTEWEMAQPFECNCGSERCKGWISGAGQMKEEVVREYWLNRHVEEMFTERAEAGNSN